MTKTIVIDRDKFYKSLDTSRKSLEQCILSGRCVSFEDYRNKVGQLHGIDTALGHFKDTIKHEEDDD